MAHEPAMPPWAAALEQRLRFFRQDPGAAMAALRDRLAEPGGEVRALDGFLGACLDLLAAAEPGLAGLCDMARAEIAAEADDRPLLAAAAGLAGCAAQVPGRAVFLAAMARGLPEEGGPAAAMLVNDLAAVGWDLPLRALQAAVK